MNNKRKLGYAVTLFLLCAQLPQGFIFSKEKMKSILEPSTKVFYLPPSVYTSSLFKELNKTKEQSYALSSACVEFNPNIKQVTISFPWINQKHTLQILPLSEDITLKKIDLKLNKNPAIVSVFDNGDVSVGLYQISNYGVYRFSLHKEGIATQDSLDNCSKAPVEVNRICKESPDEKFTYIVPINGLNLKEKPSMNSKTLDIIPYNEKIPYNATDVVYPTDSNEDMSSWLKIKWKSNLGFISTFSLSNHPICYSDSLKLKDLHEYLSTKSIIIYDIGAMSIFNELSKDGIQQSCSFKMDGYGGCTVRSYVIQDNKVIFEYETDNKDYQSGINRCEVTKEEFLRYSPFRKSWISPILCISKDNTKDP